MSFNFQLRSITTPADPAMARVRQIYQSEFPITERKPIEFLDQLFGRNDYHIMVAEAQKAVFGFAIVYISTDPAGAALLEYLAIDSGYQGRGIGTMLVRAAITSRPFLAEVEASDEADAVRRRKFYSDIGFRRLIGLSYSLPLPGAPPMELMLMNGPAKLDRETLARWLRSIYQTVYCCTPSDARLMTMLSQLPRDI